MDHDYRLDGQMTIKFIANEIHLTSDSELIVLTCEFTLENFWERLTYSPFLVKISAFDHRISFRYAFGQFSYLRLNGYLP